MMNDTFSFYWVINVVCEICVKLHLNGNKIQLNPQKLLND